MQRLQTLVPELQQAWLSRRYLLNHIAEDGFSIPNYLRQKQLANLDAIDESQVKKTKREGTRSARKPRAPRSKK